MLARWAMGSISQLSKVSGDDEEGPSGSCAVYHTTKTANAFEAMLLCDASADGLSLVLAGQTRDTFVHYNWRP